MSKDSQFRARLTTLALLAIETLAGYGLLRRESTPPIIFNFYSPQFFPIVAAFVGLWLGTLMLLIRPSARLTNMVAGAARWLRARWWLLVALLYGALEGWYALIGLGQRVFFPTMARRSFMTALLLALIWAGLVLLFAGRTRESRRATAANLGLALLSVGISFWLFSIAVTRVIFADNYQPYHSFWAGLHRYDYRLGYRGRPDSQYVNRHCAPEAGEVTIFTDELGYRNLPGARSAPLVVVGDSFAYDACHAHEDMWSTQLGAELGVEVANFSVVGGSLYHYNALTDMFVRQGNHEVLVYGLFVNDLIDDSDYDVSLHNRLATNGILYYMSPLSYTVRRYLTRSPVGQIVHGIAKSASEAPAQSKTVTLDNGIQLAPYREGVGFTSFLGGDSAVGERLETAIAYADELGLKLVVVMIPSKPSAYIDDYKAAFPQSSNLPEREEQVYDELCAWLAEREVLCLNLTEGMRLAAQDGPALYFSTDGHWNPRGSQVAADLTADFLREKDVIGQ